MGARRELDKAYLSWDRQLTRLEVSGKQKARDQVLRQIVRRARRRTWWFKLIRNTVIRTPPINLLTRLRPILSLNPTNQALLNAGKKLLQCLNEESIKSLENWISSNSKKALVVVIGCKRKKKELKAALNQLRKKESEIDIIGVIGNSKQQDWLFKFDTRNGILELPCRDTYEGLPEKVIWTCLAINLTNERGIFKVDDDTKEVNPKKLSELEKLLKTQSKHAAVSQIKVETPLQIDRGWHLGRCNGKVNKMPFEGLGPKLWMSGGAGYMVTGEGVNMLGDFCLHSWNFIQNQIYEDLTVSWILQSNGKRIHWVDDWQSIGSVNERTRELQTGRRFQRRSEPEEKEAT